MFTPKVMVISQCQKRFILCTFCWIKKKNRSNLCKIFKSIWSFYTKFYKIQGFTKYYGLCSSNLPSANCQHLKITGFHQSILDSALLFVWYSYPQYLANNYVQSLLNIPFSEKIRWDTPFILKDIAQTVTNVFAIIRRKWKKLAISDIL